MVRGCPFVKVIGTAGGDVHGVEDAPPILQVARRRRQGLLHLQRKITEGAAQPVAPCLLADVWKQSLAGLLQGLMQPGGGAVHAASLSACSSRHTISPARDAAPGRPMFSSPEAPADATGADEEQGSL